MSLKAWQGIIPLLLCGFFFLLPFYNYAGLRDSQSKTSVLPQSAEFRSSATEFLNHHSHAILFRSLRNPYTTEQGITSLFEKEEESEHLHQNQNREGHHFYILHTPGYSHNLTPAVDIEHRIGNYSDSRGHFSLFLLNRVFRI
ncbi:MAG TPA: hypothetical protein PLQ93_10045 [Bacteroidia bacterium]|nr:hypothetical protein [Bacteroidia bacterium]